MQQFFRILGAGRAIPSTVWSAADVERDRGLPEGWIEKHTMVANRYACLPPESACTMACEAVQSAFAKAGIGWSDVDLIIDCSTSLQQPIPCNAAMLQSAFGKGAHGIPCMDIHSTCLGFLLSLNVVNGLMASGSIRTALVIASETLIGGVHWSEPESATLMCDAAGAVLLGRRDNACDMFFRHETFADEITACQVLGGGHRLPFFEYRPERESEFRFSMDGPRLFRIALKRLPPLIEDLLQEACSDPMDRSSLLVVPHQASPHAVEAIRRICGFTQDQFENRTSKIGNMAAASIPFLLSCLEDEKRLREGGRVLLMGTSAGYSQAAMVFQL